MVEVEQDEGCGTDPTDPPRVDATLRSALKVIFSRALPRSPIARTPLCALLNCCWSAVSMLSFGFVNATVMVSASPS
nr:hypothetical protein [uncultured bacterium]